MLDSGCTLKGGRRSGNDFVIAHANTNASQTHSALFIYFLFSFSTLLPTRRWRTSCRKKGEGAGRLRDCAKGAQTPLISPQQRNVTDTPTHSQRASQPANKTNNNTANKEQQQFQQQYFTRNGFKRCRC